MTDCLSNVINTEVCPSHYEFDWARLVLFDALLNTTDLPDVAAPPRYEVVTDRPRGRQTADLLRRLDEALVPCRHGTWLAARGTDPSAARSIDYTQLSRQDLFDLYLYPDDHILDWHGVRIVPGPVFADRRGGVLAGVCVRNTSNDLDFVRDAKYTFSNFGWFLYGLDLYQRGDLVFVVEGVFDAIAMRAHGLRAIAIGSCNPTAAQLACLAHRYDNLVVCFDNDFWGHYGAYVAARALRAPVVFPYLKDVSCHHEAGEMPQLWQTDLTELRTVLVDEIADYNRLVATDWQPTRELPYNNCGTYGV